MMFATVLVAQSPAPLEQRYLTVETALDEIFGHHVTTADTLTISADLADRFATSFGAPPSIQQVPLYLVGEGSHLEGYAMIWEEVGKYYPITFLVATSLEGRVLGVRVLIYRESHGGDVRRSRFLSQYKGKGPESAVRTHRDIINLSGATLSVNAMNRGVRKVLHLIDHYRKGRP